MTTYQVVCVEAETEYTEIKQFSSFEEAADYLKFSSLAGLNSHQIDSVELKSAAIEKARGE
jgi:hypothetical protein